MFYVLPFLVFGAVLAFWYWNYFRQVKAAGGADALAAKQLREEFGLGADEQVSFVWDGLCYIGPLRPGGGDAGFGAKLFNAVATAQKRGAQVHLCVTDRGRLGISMEPVDGAGREAAIAKSSFGFGTFYRPFALVSAGAGKLYTFAEAFAGASYPSSEAPERRSAAGGATRYELVYLDTGQSGLSLWVDPGAVEPVRRALGG